MSDRIEELLDQIPSDLWELEILPHLTYHQLTKVARVSKKFANIVKNTAPFIIDTHEESWLDQTRVRQNVERCRYLTLNGSDHIILDQISKSNKLQLEKLDAHLVDQPDRATITQCIKNILKNNKAGALKELSIGYLDFKNMLDVTCPSVTKLIISDINHHRNEELVLATADLIKIFPSLKWLHIDSSINNDLYQYLVDHSDTPLEHVTIPAEQVSDKHVTAPLKSLKFIREGPDDPNLSADNFNTKYMTRLELEGFTFLGPQNPRELSFPNLETLEFLSIQCELDDKSALLFEHATRLTHLEVDEPHADMKYPQSLKSLIVPHDDLPIDKIAALPNLEILTIEREGTGFWMLEQCACTTSLQRLTLCSDNVAEWSSMMNQFVNLTHVNLELCLLNDLPKEFFQNCTKITHFSLKACEGITAIPPELNLLTQLEHFCVGSCNLMEIPSGLKDLPNLQSIDLRGNPFTLESVPVTLPVKTVVFRDREWIQLIQRYIADPSNAPTVAQMLKLPYLSNGFPLETGRLARVALHAFNIPGIELEANDTDSDRLATAIKGMRRAVHEYHSTRVGKVELPYLDKGTTVGIVLAYESFERSETLKNRVVRVECDETSGKITTYSFSVNTKKGKDRGWSSRACWDLRGHIHVFEGMKVTETENKLIRSIMEGK